MIFVVVIVVFKRFKGRRTVLGMIHEVALTLLLVFVSSVTSVRILVSILSATYSAFWSVLPCVSLCCRL